MTPQTMAETPASSLMVASLLDPSQTINLEEAVRERVRLHPQAHVQEIVAMLELAGADAPSDLVQQVIDQHRSEANGDAWNYSPPAPRVPR